MFNASTFLNQSVTGPLSTKIPVVPAGDYRAKISKLEPQAGTDKIGPLLRVVWELVDTGELAAIDRERATVRQDIFLDMDDSQENLDAGEGKNVGLGRLFEALGMNDGGAAIGNLMGQVAYIKVAHRADKKDTSIVYDFVSRVAPLS